MSKDPQQDSSQVGDSDPVLMEIKGLMMDPVSNVPIVVLRNEESNQFLPIWIGVFEANSIALQLEDVEPPRPMTHDLSVALLEAVGVAIEKVVVTDLVDGTFYAEIHLRFQDRTRKVDSRPSDAIALALRVDAPVYVSMDVLEKARADDRTEQLTKDEKIRKWLEDLDPDDLGEYTM
ncbi:MAG: bifunctional nuclease family protein [Thermoanaerobaculia bacterium]|nr:bifunctional nuclease family protein [Thermoanaerobaculia bacterium]